MTDFYSSLAEDYDEMTRFETRLPALRATWERVFAGKVPKTALDVATGTGVCAIALAQLGVEVIGTDPVHEMVARARENAVNLSLLNARFELATMQDAVPGVTGVDLVTCLGNSIPHVPRHELHAVAARFRDTLADGGVAVLQLKNFEKILADGKRFVSADRTGDRELIRFYDLSETAVTFTILRLTWRDGRATPDWMQTDMTPFSREDFEEAFRGAGFSDVSFYATIDRAPFDAHASSDLVVYARV